MRRPRAKGHPALERHSPHRVGQAGGAGGRVSGGGPSALANLVHTTRDRDYHSGFSHPNTPTRAPPSLRNLSNRPSSPSSVHGMETATPSKPATPDGVWTHGPVQLARGRAAKDPHVQTTTYANLSSLDDFEASLHAYLENPPAAPEHSECQLGFWIGTSFLVQPPQAAPPPSAPQGFQPAASTLDAHYAAAANAANASNNAQSDQGSPSSSAARMAMSMLEALAPNPDPKERMKKQRAIAKAIVDSIQRVDGFRYSFHNNWNSREDDAYRFSYYCNDSLLNKDRAANGKGAKLGRNFRFTQAMTVG